jgi:pimeloyl-ACP methyl ester carboxylesterase
MIPESVLRIYERTGHFVPEERPTNVAQDIVDFFGNVEP